MLAEPRLALAILVGAVIGIPGASYLTALHDLVTGKYSTATQVIAVFVFVFIGFLLIIIPFAFLELRPETTKARLKRSQAWLLGHAQQLVVAVALAPGRLPDNKRPGPTDLIAADRWPGLLPAAGPCWPSVAPGPGLRPASSDSALSPPLGDASTARRRCGRGASELRGPGCGFCWLRHGRSL